MWRQGLGRQYQVQMPTFVVHTMDRSLAEPLIAYPALKKNMGESFGMWAVALHFHFPWFTMSQLMNQVYHNSPGLGRDGYILNSGGYVGTGSFRGFGHGKVGKGNPPFSLVSPLPSH